MKLGKILALMGAFSLVGLSQAGAALINLTHDPKAPDFSADQIDVNYNYGTQLFTATGRTFKYSNGYASITAANSWALSAHIDHSGTLLDGTVTVKAKLAGMGAADILLTGVLRPGAGGSAFGYQDTQNGTIFEFTFTSFGGNNPSVIQDFLKWGTVGGITLNATKYDATGYFTGNWNSSFHNTANAGVADTYVPEPLACGLWAGLLAITGLWSRRRCSSFKQFAVSAGMPAAN